MGGFGRASPSVPTPARRSIHSARLVLNASDERELCHTCVYANTDRFSDTMNFNESSYDPIPFHERHESYWRKSFVPLNVIREITDATAGKVQLILSAHLSLRSLNTKMK